MEHIKSSDRQPERSTKQQTRSLATKPEHIQNEIQTEEKVQRIMDETIQHSKMLIGLLKGIVGSAKTSIGELLAFAKEIQGIETKTRGLYDGALRILCAVLTT